MLFPMEIPIDCTGYIGYIQGSHPILPRGETEGGRENIGHDP
jgi:hypothetical protein